MSTGRWADDEVLQEVVTLEVAVKQVYGDSPDEDYYEERVTAGFARVYNPPPEAASSTRELRPTTRRALPPPPGLRTDRPTTGAAANGRRPDTAPAPLIVDASDGPADRGASSGGEHGHDRRTGTPGRSTVTPERASGPADRPSVDASRRPHDAAPPPGEAVFQRARRAPRPDQPSQPSAAATRQFSPRGHEASRPSGRPNPPRSPDARQDAQTTFGRPAPGPSSLGSPSLQRGGTPLNTGPGLASPKPEDLSYTDRIPVRDLLPPQQVVPGRGWRKFVFRSTFGLINLGRSPDELYEEQLQATVRSHLRGPYKIGVLGKGGVGKTTLAASVGSVFAELRKNDPLVAIDADTSFGKLASRVDPKAQGSYWELNAEDHLDTFADMRARLGINAAGLFVLANEANPARRRALEPAVYREAVLRLGRFFPLQIIDCGAAVDSPVTQEVLSHLDALIVVTSPWVDGAAAAGQILDWLATRELTNLLQHTVIVLNDSDGHASRRMKSILAKQFRSGGHVVIEVPFDRRLRPGGVITGTPDISAKPRRRFLEIAAELATQFASRDVRARDPR